MKKAAEQTPPSTHKRGRRTILTPSIKVLIERRLRMERRKPPEEQAPIRLLAYEIRKELKDSKIRNVPEQSTLEKYIRFSKSKPNPLDEPWEVFTLKDYPIPPEALPIVLDMWVWTLHNLDMQLTIREAQWIARLSGVYDYIPHAMFSSFADIYATSELVAEQEADIQSIGQSVDLSVWRYITETDDPSLDVLNLSERINKNPYYATYNRPSPKEVSLFQEAEKLGKKIPPGAFEYKRRPKIREVTNEREYKTKRQE